MKKSKKLIAMLLTLMMLLSILPVAAFAKQLSTVEITPDTSGTTKNAGTVSVGDFFYVTVYNDNAWADVTYTITLENNSGVIEVNKTALFIEDSCDGSIKVTAANPGTEKITVSGTSSWGTFSASVEVTVEAAAPAGDSVKYIDKNGSEQTATATKLTESSTSWSGWVYVTGDVTIENAVTLSENVNLILTDGASLEITKGIPTSNGKALTVYVQTNGTGTLTVKGEDKTTTTGGTGMAANLTVCGGIVDITGGNGGTNETRGMGMSGGYALNGTLTVYGGEVAVTAGNGGNGRDDTCNAGGGGYGVVKDLTVYGGKVTVTGGNGGTTGKQPGAGGKAVNGTVLAEGMTQSATAPDGTTGGILIISSAPAHTHTVGTKNEAVAPTCTADGTIEWYSCTDPECTAKLDKDGKVLESIVDPAKGHTYGDPVAVWTGDSCTATRTCTKCSEVTDGHSISEAKKGTFVQDTAATCIEAAKGHYEVSFDDTQFGTAQTDANTVSNGNPIEHSYTGEYVQNEEHTKHAQLCVNGCGLPGEYTDCTGGKATCQAKAVCETCEHEYGELAGHSFTNYVYNNDASCIKAGTETAKCDNCEATDTVDDLEHPQLEHSYTGEVKDNGDGTHSFLCVNGCGEYGGTVECVDELGDGYCDICGATLDPLAQDRADAIAKLEAIVNGNTNEKVQSMLASYVDQINNASSLNEINSIVAKATSALKQQIEIANEGSLVSAIRAFVNLCDNNHQKTTNKVMGIIKPILGLFGIK